MSTIEHEVEQLAEVQQFMTPDLITAVHKRAQQLTNSRPVAVVKRSAHVQAISSKAPLVKRLGTTPRPLSELFILQ